MWWIQPQEIADKDGNETGRWRMTAKSDEGGGGPFGDVSHDHASAEESQACEQCDEFVNGVAGFPSRKAEVERRAKSREDRMRAALEEIAAWDCFMYPGNKENIVEIAKKALAE